MVAAQRGHRPGPARPRASREVPGARRRRQKAQIRRVKAKAFQHLADAGAAGACYECSRLATPTDVAGGSACVISESACSRPRRRRPLPRRPRRRRTNGHQSARASTDRSRILPGSTPPGRSGRCRSRTRRRTVARPSTRPSRTSEAALWTRRRCGGAVGGTPGRAGGGGAGVNACA